MEIIEKGIKNRILDVQTLTTANDNVQVAEKDFDKYYDELAKLVGDNYPALRKLGESVNNLRFFETESAYRVGLSDGMQLQQEVNALIK